MIMQYRYYLLYKPLNVLCQFSPLAGKRTLSEFGIFPKDVYPAGRLDADSEGLLLLTNDGGLIHRLLEPEYGHPRTYLVQVERIPEEDSIRRMREGILIGGKRTLPADVELLSGEPALPPRPVPIRFRKTVPTAWLQITLREGRNRQVRRMTAAAGHPALRLVRVAIGPIRLGALEPGESREATAEEVRRLYGMVTNSRTSGLSRSGASSRILFVQGVARSARRHGKGRRGR